MENANKASAQPVSLMQIKPIVNPFRFLQLDGTPLIQLRGRLQFT